MEAIEIQETAHVITERCIGCGLCIPTCETDALHLMAKNADLQVVPPKSLVGTYLQLAKERGLVK